MISYGITKPQRFNTLWPSHNGCPFPDHIFKCIFLNENVWISIKISLKFVPKGPISDIPALVQLMAWYRPGNKPLSEPMMVSLLTHICIIRHQWVNCQWKSFHIISFSSSQCSSISRMETVISKIIFQNQDPTWYHGDFHCGRNMNTCNSYLSAGESPLQLKHQRFNQDRSEGCLSNFSVKDILLSKNYLLQYFNHIYIWTMQTNKRYAHINPNQPPIDTFWLKTVSRGVIY